MSVMSDRSIFISVTFFSTVSARAPVSIRMRRPSASSTAAKPHSPMPLAPAPPTSIVDSTVTFTALTCVSAAGLRPGRPRQHGHQHNHQRSLQSHHDSPGKQIDARPSIAPPVPVQFSTVRSRPVGTNSTACRLPNAPSTTFRSSTSKAGSRLATAPSCSATPSRPSSLKAKPKCSSISRRCPMSIAAASASWSTARCPRRRPTGR